MSMKPDLSSRAQVEKLISAFYARVSEDALLGPVFRHVDWPHHLPIMVNFWSSMLLGDQSYRGNPFQKHIHLPIGREHFDQWLHLFYTTLNEHFSGPIAEEAKTRAASIATLFQHRLGLTA
ncbi:group III truncated hemoglobin [Chryseolinea soli]|uniref:Group III truncated hemoglobin n=2 Tax=Chryseolinea soli TaxID=2321403 RepID=A0A385SP49_9BACT|nr:group III truncated hemoglobin [Chryseolinea soli]